MTEFTGHKDPFLGMCIHGVQGARFIDGQLKSPSCFNCVPETFHSCPLEEEIHLNYEPICQCDKEGIRDCQMSI